MIKRTITIISTFTVLFLLICAFAVSNIYADEGLKLNVDEINMDELESAYCGIYPIDSSEEQIDTVEASQKGVLYIDKEDGYYCEVRPVGIGDVILTVTGDGGSVIKVPVHVGKKAIENALDSMEFGYIDYGDKNFTLSTLPGASVTVQIGKDKYKTTTPQGDYKSYRTIKLKKVYNYGTKVKATIVKDGVTCSFSSKVFEDTSLGNIQASGKVFKVHVYNVHKGDVVKIKYAGKTYSKKIKKNCHRRRATVTIKAKKKIKKSAKIKFEIRNKYKTVLEKHNLKLQKGKAYVYFD